MRGERGRLSESGFAGFFGIFRIRDGAPMTLPAATTASAPGRRWLWSVGM